MLNCCKIITLIVLIGSTFGMPACGCCGPIGRLMDASRRRTSMALLGPPKPCVHCLCGVPDHLAALVEGEECLCDAEDGNGDMDMKKRLRARQYSW